MTGSTPRERFKDDDLDHLADRYNIAQFVSFAPGLEPRQRHARVREPTEPAAGGDRVEAAIEIVLRRSGGSVNVRSFRPASPRGNPFHYGLTSAADASAIVRRLAADGYYTIANELIDITDGGVSGVAIGDLIEFAPLATPRAVEEPEAAALPREFADRLLATVYGFAPRLPPTAGYRVEFSIHPIRVGLRREHTIVWETTNDMDGIRPLIYWPNRFSRFVGDKVFGLLIADAIGLPVPAAVAVGRNVAPFRLGRSTSTNEIWLRTCPAEQVPGKYPTRKGWTDPYALLDTADPTGTAVVAILAQESVDAVYSGASHPLADGPDLIEGVAGHGNRFMLGEIGPEPLPSDVVADVRAVAEQARRSLGPVRLEWAHDGRQAWLLQLHVVTEFARHGVLSAGEPRGGWIDVDPSGGLPALQRLIEHARNQELGVTLTRAVGYTSHVGDLLRKAGIPSRFRTG